MTPVNSPGNTGRKPIIAVDEVGLPPAQLTVRRPGWQPRKITVGHVDGSKRFVQAEVYKGLFAVHLCTDDREDRKSQWMVTALKCDHGVLWLPNREEAVKAAEFLVENFTEAFGKPTKGEVLYDLDRWVKHWVKDCLSQRKLLPTEPYSG